ncbi:MAG: N-acetyltransferase family protein [Nitrospinales bacterium]
MQKIQRNLRDYGLRETSKKVAVTMLSPLYHHRVYRIYCIDLNSINGIESRPFELQFKINEPTDDNTIRQIEGMEEWLQGLVAKKLENHSICLAALEKGKVAGFNIVSFGRVYIPLLRISKNLGEHEAWSEQITVDRPYRRIGLGYELRRRIFKELKRRNILNFCGGTLRSNQLSLGLARRLGFREIEDIHFIKLLGIKKWIRNEVK